MLRYRCNSQRVYTVRDRLSACLHISPPWLSQG